MTTSPTGNHWQAVVDSLGLTVSSDGQAYGPCPVHGGKRQSAFSVGKGENGWPVLTCWTKCKDSQRPGNDKRRGKWFKEACNTIIAQHPELRAHLRPSSGLSTPEKATRAQEPLPDDLTILKWSKSLLGSSAAQKRQRKFLIEERGISVETIRRFQIGIFYDRLTIPVRAADGSLVNVRKYKPHHNGSDKVIGIKGRNQPRLFPEDPLALADPSDAVLVCEAELDALIAIDRGFNAVTGTGGASTVPASLEPFRGRKVYIAFDCDEAGRVGSVKWAKALMSIASEVYVLDLGLADGEDITDWFVTHGRSAKKLKKLMKRARPFDPDDVDDDAIWLNTIEESELSWLWEGRLPFGKIAMLEGDPGLGKSTIWVDVVARLTTGRSFPESDQPTNVGRALVIAGEDDFSDTIIPRLKAAGADLDFVGTLLLARDSQGNVLPLTLPEDLVRIGATIRRHKVKLLVIDPVMAYMSETIMTGSDASVRRALTPLAELMQQTGCAALLVRHLNKSGDMQAIYRGGGSIAFIGAARSGLVVAPHPEQPGVVVMSQTKTNLSRKGQAITYEVAKRTDDENRADTYIQWGEAIDMDADDLLGKKTTTPERAEAIKFLQAELVDGPLPSSTLKTHADEAGIVWKTVERAKKAAGAESIPVRGEDGRVSHWLWSTGPEVIVERSQQEDE